MEVPGKLEVPKGINQCQVSSCVKNITKLNNKTHVLSLVESIILKKDF
jgi:hypothetical protein